MATANPTLTFDSTSDANFRAWGSGISSALQTCGLVQTTDTGQINWTTVTRTNVAYSGGGIENVVGYEIYKFNDSLQATVPVFIKIEYGYIGDDNASHSARVITAPVLFITVSNATNGAGAMNGTLLSGRTRVAGGTPESVGSSTADGSGTTATPSPCFFSGNGSYINIALGVTTVAQPTYSSVAGQTHYSSFPAILTIERSLNTDGSINNNGVYLLTSKWTTSDITPPTVPVPTSQMLSYSLGAAPVDSFWPIGWPGQGFGSGTFNATVSLWPMMGYTGAAFQGSAMLGIYNSDIACGTVISTTVLGNTHSYVSLAGISTTRFLVDNNIASAAGLMRYD